MRNMKIHATVEEYLADAPEPARATLTKIRAIIRSAVPKQATEKINYGMPMFMYHGMVCGYAAFKDHCSLFPGAAEIEAYRDELKNFEISKGTIRFPMDKPPSAALIKKLVKHRVYANEEKELIKLRRRSS